MNHFISNEMCSSSKLKTFGLNGDTSFSTGSDGFFVSVSEKILQTYTSLKFQYWKKETNSWTFFLTLL